MCLTQMQVYIDYIKNIDWSQQQQRRSGVIVYTTYGRRVLFLLGIDTQSGNITDFGGGIKLKYETPLSGGLRELREESCGIFGDIEESDVSDHLAIYTNDLVIIFIHIKFDINFIMTEFNKRRDVIPDPEVDSLILMTIDQFESVVKGESINNRIMYVKIQEVLQGAMEQSLMEYL